MEHLLVSPSRINTFLACPKKHDYVYNQELVPLEARKRYFDKGNYFHELSHVYYQMVQAGATPGSDVALAAIINRIQQDISRTTSMDLIPVYHNITRVITRFIKDQSPLVDYKITVEQVEAELRYDLQGFSMFGYADLIYRDTNGKIRIRDHKTGDKAWSKLDAQFSNQLLFYACIIFKLTGEVPVAEISYVNTKEYVKKAPDHEAAFNLTTVTYSRRELEIYFDEICMLIEDVVNSRPVPHYGQQCGYCPYNGPCFLSRKGLDPTPMLNQHFKVVPRSTRHGTFTEEHTADDTAD